MWVKNLAYRNTTKNVVIKAQNDSWLDIFYLRSMFSDLKSINSIIVGGNFQKAERSRSIFRQQQNFGFTAANFRGVCSEIVTLCLWLMFEMLVSLLYDKWFEDSGAEDLLKSARLSFRYCSRIGFRFFLLDILRSPLIPFDLIPPLCNLPCQNFRSYSEKLYSFSRSYSTLYNPRWDASFWNGTP